MKVVTYNVNGLRPRVAQFGSLRRLLALLDADIVCFQETKLTRQDLSADLTMVEGYEAFLSCSRVANKGRGGYSGVATFCRVKSAFSSNEVALPIAAAEGITGFLEKGGALDISEGFVLEIPFVAEGLDEVSKEELIKVDSEGRCVITDHGHFVLFNLYGPRAEDDNSERVRFKLLFFKVLQKRWEYLLAQGKRVFVVGDLNIAPASIDRCDAEPGFERHMFRQWLRSMLRNCGGPFFDVFRSLHPARTGAYTCFSQRIGAEVYNYGSRIDHILISGRCFHSSSDLDSHQILSCHVEECEIMVDYKRGNSADTPKWKGGRTIKVDGSDHIPVYVVLSGIPDAPIHSTPPLAVRYLPELRGYQQSIVSYFAKGRTLDAPESPCRSGLDDSASQKPSTLEILSQGSVTTAIRKAVTKRKDRDDVSSQLSIKSFFKSPQTSAKSDKNCNHEDIDCSISAADVRTSGKSDGATQNTECTDISAENDQMVSFSCEEGSDLLRTEILENSNSALLEWQRIHQKMKTSLPLCRGHKEPCIPRSVKKGANIGRLFYVCPRAQGPSSNPEANCGHFQWASSKPKERHKKSK